MHLATRLLVEQSSHLFPHQRRSALANVRLSHFIGVFHAAGNVHGIAPARAGELLHANDTGHRSAGVHARAHLESGKALCIALGFGGDDERLHEWNQDEVDAQNAPKVVKDANGSVLRDGDDVAVIKDLPLKGAPKACWAVAKVRGIRIVGGDHTIDCKVGGFGAMVLASEFVKKA